MTNYAYLRVSSDNQDLNNQKFGILDYLLVFAICNMSIACLGAIRKKTGMRGRIF